MKSRQAARSALAFGVAFSFSLPAFAQQHNLKEAAQQAVLGNPEVLQRWHAYQAAGNEREAAFGGYLPRVDLIAGAGREQRDDPLLRNDYSRRNASLTLTQMLYDGFATRREVERLDHARQVRLYELLDASEAAALEAARAYLDVLRYRRLVSLAEENYVRHRAVFEQIQQKVQAGVGRRVDLEQAAGRLALAEANLLTETSNLHDVSARYQRVVGAQPGAQLASPPRLDTGLPADAGAALQAAQGRSPTIRAAIENLRSAQAALGVRQAAYQPRVDLKLRNDRGTDLNGYTGRTDNRTAEVVLTWNLFNGLSDQARARQYTDQIEVARDLRDKACRDVHQTTAIAYHDTRKLVEQLGYLDQHQLSTEKARDAYRKQFDIGQRSLLDLLDTENELFQAKRAYGNAEYDLLIAQVRTQAGLGQLLATLGLRKLGEDGVADPASWDAAGDAPAQCPSEGPVLYTADKAALNARAAELLRESAPPPPPAVPAGVAEVRSALQAWADAWTARNVEAYLAAYGPDFVPADGTGRTAWAAKRRQVIGQAGEIELELTEVHVELTGPRHAITSFTQRYRTATYADVAAKTVTWEKIDGRWLIVAERVEP